MIELRRWNCDDGTAPSDEITREGVQLTTPAYYPGEPQAVEPQTPPSRAKTIRAAPSAISAMNEPRKRGMPSRKAATTS